MSGCRNIYLSDDDSDDRLLFEQAFEEVCDGHNLTMFDDNEKLLTALQSKTPDLLFIDLNMPRLNGLETLTSLKELPHLKDLPVIIYSTIETPIFIEEVYDLGAAYFIKKPYDYYELVRLIKYVMDVDWNDVDQVSMKDFVLSYSRSKKPSNDPEEKPLFK